MTDVLAVAEHRRGDLRDVSLELLAAGRDLANATDGALHVAVVGGDVDALAEGLRREGVDRIHTVEAGATFNHDVAVRAVGRLADAIAARFLIAPHTAAGMDYAPALANRLELPLVTDAIDLELADDRLRAIREMYGSKVETTLAVSAPRVAVTVRPGEWDPAPAGGDAEVTAADVAVEPAVGTRIRGFEEPTAGDVDITDAEVLVAVGRGIEEEENLELIFELADALDATVAASRPIVDNGWLEKHRQVGQSGKTVSPAVYIAIGISGAVQHVSGMKGSETVVAINTDPDAPIMDVADYAICDDLFDVVPRLTEQFSG